MNYFYELGTYGFMTDTSVTSFPEERRQWRGRIEDHITDKAQEINDNVDEAESSIINRVDEAESKINQHLDTIEQKVDSVNSYIVETIKPQLDTIEGKINDVNSYITGTLTQYVDQVEGYTDSLEGSQTAQDTMLQRIYNKVSVLPSNWNWGY